MRSPAGKDISFSCSRENNRGRVVGEWLPRAIEWTVLRIEYESPERRREQRKVKLAGLGCIRTCESESDAAEQLIFIRRHPNRQFSLLPQRMAPRTRQRGLTSTRRLVDESPQSSGATFEDLRSSSDCSDNEDRNIGTVSLSRSNSPQFRAYYTLASARIVTAPRDSKRLQ